MYNGFLDVDCFCTIFNMIDLVQRDTNIDNSIE